MARFRGGRLLIMALVATTTGEVCAQEPAKLWVTGAMVVSMHNPGESDSPYLSGPFGGEALGVVVGIQVPAGSGFRVGFEAGYDGAIEGLRSWRAKRHRS